MYKILKINKQVIILSVIIFLISILFFYLVIELNITTDIKAHYLALKESVYYGKFPIPPLYYLSIYILSGFNRIFNLENVVVLVLSCAIVGKYLASLQLANYIYSIDYKSKPVHYLYILVALFLFLSSIFYDFENFNFSLGRIPSSTWHNSTLIFLMPFAILLFHYSFKFIQENKFYKKIGSYILILGIINLLIKPSFLFVFIPAFPLTVLVVEKNRSKKVIYSFALSLILFFLLLIEYYFIYVFNLSSLEKEQSNGIGIAPFLIFKNYSTNLFLDFIVSTLFPIISLLVIKKIRYILIVRYSLLMYIIAFLIAILVIETGNRMYHGNFVWQLIITNYILFLVIGISVLKEIQLNRVSRLKSFLIFIVFLLHLFSGIGYLIKIIILKNVS